MLLGHPGLFHYGYIRTEKNGNTHAYLEKYSNLVSQSNILRILYAFKAIVPKEENKYTTQVRKNIIGFHEREETSQIYCKLLFRH